MTAAIHVRTPDDAERREGVRCAMDVLQTVKPRDVATLMGAVNPLIAEQPNRLVMMLLAIEFARLIHTCTDEVRMQLICAFGELVAAHLVARDRGAAFCTLNPEAMADIPAEGNA